jgi:hypothetical protein
VENAAVTDFERSNATASNGACGTHAIFLYLDYLGDDKWRL